MTEATETPCVVLSIRKAGVAVVELNRPLKRNALSQGLIDELTGVLRQVNRDATIRTLVLTSVDHSPFCAGADLNELAKVSTAEAFQRGWLKDLQDGFSSFGKPIIAAVRGFAFGGGFEIALMCDMIFAAEDARFGFPEIKLGTLPGAGGTQRLARAMGRQKAMEIVLTGSPTTALVMERFGIVNRVVPAGQDVLEEALKVAEVTASFSAPAIRLAKQAIKAAETTTFDAGLDIERALYYSSFSLADCEEGIAAFLQKRSPNFQHK
ncbi:enoyl-CoA hydratase [Massarina eburnea CBS 473.64]|uniref:Enoyl-CoA hydratase n=1 Tax=Massarina eburnea CBS 473.64 TaxID=1395130 RepID=A0A6A6SE83_9PLEO|nr:enoyl-CoA hydratase [Massarina eburnea CBS 473.64]